MDQQSMDLLGTWITAHTHCSLLFEIGASIKEVQERLDHSDVKTTMDIYTHVTKKTKASMIDKFEAYLKMTIFDPKMIQKTLKSHETF